MNLTRLSTWRWGAGALLAGIVVLAACDGENLFDTSNNPFITPQIQVSAPDGAFAGDTIGIAVSATASVELSTIAVSIRGAVTKDTTIITASQRSVSVLVKVALPAILTDTLIYVSAIATDRNGNVSKVKSDTVSVLGPPVIVSVTGADSLALGTTTTLRIRAFGSRRVTQMDVSMRGAVNRDTTIFVVPPVNDATVNVPISIPAIPTDTSVRVTIIARDVTGLSSATTTVNVPLRIAAPTVTVTAPATVTAGSNLNLNVTAIAMRGVATIRTEITGQNMAQIVNVKTLAVPTTTAQEVISIPLPLGLTDSLLTIRVFAIDRAGTVSAPATATTRRTTSAPPAITSLTTEPATSVRAGQSVTVFVSAQGALAINKLTLLVSGAVNPAPITVPITQGTSVSGFVQIPIPTDVTDTLLTIIAIATDVEGNLSSAAAPQARRVLTVTDVTPPVVSATVTPATTAAGATILIRVSARDNVSVTRIGYAVVNPAGDTVGVTPTLVTTSGAVKDTTFSFIVPATITPRTVRVFGLAFDASGRRGISTAVSVTVADSAAPTITFNAPAANSTLPLNDSVRVQVRVQDPTGIKSIRLIGQSTRVDSLGPTRVITRFAEKIITFPANPGQPLPTDTTITRYLLANPDSISEPVQIIATAADSIGNQASVTTTILVGGPRVELRNPTPGAQVTPGGTLLLTAFAVDRSAGIDSVLITLTGAQSQRFTFIPGCPAATCTPNGLTSNDSVRVNQNYVVGAATGTVTITATAWNRNRVAGQSSPVSILVSTTAVTDAAPPQVRVAMTSNDRIELRDTISLTLAAQDVGPSGLRRMGVVVVAAPSGLGAPPPDTLYLDSLFTGSGRTGLQPATFKFTLADFGYTETNLIRLPRTLSFQVHAFAVDTVGNVGCNVTNTLATLVCDTVVVVPAPTASGQTAWFTARSSTGLSQLVTVVPGFSRPLLNPSDRIADVIVDNNPAQPRMFLSNIAQNRVEWLDIVSPGPLQTISVGSEPWGMFLANAPGGDGMIGTADDNPTRLIVANSGGTNLSFVNLNTLREEPLERVLTPNAVLFDVSKQTTNNTINYLITYHDFSDRPQFVAQDANGIFLYSTKPTGAAPDGTVRFLQPAAGPRAFESKILYTRDAVEPSVDNWAIANIDSITSGITLWDHVPGNPTAVFSATSPDIDVAIANLRTAGSDIDANKSGRWNLAVVGLSDTTYVAASGNRDFVAFGEGGTGPFASVWLWRKGPAPGTAGSLSDNLTVRDLIGNSAERVLGIALNHTGNMGAARGAVSTSFFTNNVASAGDLRLQGVFSNGVAGGNGGVALHPDHASASTCTEQTLSFIATVNRSIKIVDTFHFRERGEIQIRDNIVSPLRASRPLAIDNPPAAIGTPDEIIAKLYGVTGAGRATIINVRRRDLVNMTGCP